MHWGILPMAVAVAAFTLAMGLDSTPSVAAEVEPVRLIFDTDICGDCDDVLALGMIHALQSRGHCRLLAVTISVDNEQAAPFVDAVNTFYGRGDIPIGVVGQGGVVEKSAFLSLVEEKDAAGRLPISPRPALGPLGAGRDGGPPQGAGRPAGSFGRRSRRSGSPPTWRGCSTRPRTSISPLSGLELVRRKVKLLSLMAGAFTTIEGNSHYREYNVIKDVKSAQALAERWPTLMVYSGFEIGIALAVPGDQHRARLRIRPRITRWPRPTSAATRRRTTGRPGT